MSFTVDGVEWDVPCDIDREAEIRSSEVSGYMLDGSYFNDVIGTYMKYDVSLVVPVNRLADYSGLYEVLSAPVPAHAFVFPYNQGTVTVVGRVSVVSDSYAGSPNGATLWRRTKFSVISNRPHRSTGLPEVLDTMGEATFTENGVYSADGYGYDGFSTVTVAVPAAAGEGF